MLKPLQLLTAAAFIALAAAAEPFCEDGICYPSRAAYEAASKESAPADESSIRVKCGYMDAGEFIAFLENREAPAPLGTSALLALCIAFLAGLALDLSPCTLPLIPVSVAVIGAGKGASRGEGFARGSAYGAGIAVVFGAMGLAAAYGAASFGSIQSWRFFPVACGAVFVLMGAASLGLFSVDFSRLRSRLAPHGAAASAAGAKRSLAGVFALGAVAALAAGSCTAPAVVAVCAYAASGGFAAKLAPFAMGLGMASPWPLLGAGFSALPKPGAWMGRLHAAMGWALVVFGLVWAARAFFRASPPTAPDVGEEEAAADSRPVLYAIGAPWCRNCAAMERNVLSRDDVKRALGAFRLRRVEIESFDELKLHAELSRVKVAGLPAYVVFPASN